jgi:hypothetical protein
MGMATNAAMDGGSGVGAMTSVQMSLGERYEALQSQWRELAIDHGHPYLKYLAPRAPVDFVLVGKMTSIADKDRAETPPGEYPVVPPPGFNLMLSLGDLILNYGAHRHLCKPGERFYLTDLGKCALPAKDAKGKREQGEFAAWYPMLLEEIELVAKPDATVIPVSSTTGNFLKGRPDFPYPLAEPILHWSMAAGAAAKMASSFFPQEWTQFRQSTGREELWQSVKEILSEAGLDEHLDCVRDRIMDKFRDIHLHYMFTYKKELPLRRPGVIGT